MKKVFGIAIAATILFTTSLANFTDMDETHWAYSAVNKMQKATILSGYNDGSFKPGKNITFAEFATIFTKIFEISQDTVSNYVTDVTNTHWAKGYVEAVREYINPYYDSIGEAIGITDYSYLVGLPADMEMTRESFIYAVSRIYGFDSSRYATGEEKTLFADSEDILFPKETVLAYKNGIISGEKLRGEVYIRPNRPITRAEASAIFNNLLKYEATRVTNKNEEPQLKAAFSDIVNKLQKEGISSAKSFVYDTQNVLSNPNFKISNESELAINEILNIVLKDFKYEVIDADFYSFNRGYIKIKVNCYDISYELENILQAVINGDTTMARDMVLGLKEKINSNKIQATEKEEVINFAKYDGNWKLMIK